MKISNLARRLEDFAAIEEQAREDSRRSPRIALAAAAAPLRRRPMLENRRIGIRDSGLRQFRVF